MAVRPIVKYPDPVLLTPTRLVGAITDDIRKLVADMWETMYDAPGVGLAANQIGVPLRVAIIDTRDGEEKPDKGHKIVLVDPVVLETKGTIAEDEGCLSFPGFTERVESPAWVRVRARDLDGREYEIAGDGLFGRALRHETDHLDGVTFIDRMSALKRDLIKRKIRKMRKAGDWPEPGSSGAGEAEGRAGAHRA
jgi:peptide deformylase